MDDAPGLVGEFPNDLYRDGGSIPDAIAVVGAVGLGMLDRQHPSSFFRPDLEPQKYVPCNRLEATRDGRYIWLIGLVLVRHRPGSAKGVMFITIEDESGVANLIDWPRIFETNRRIVMGARMLGLYGQVQREGEVVHVIVKKLFDLTSLLWSLGSRDQIFPLPMGLGDDAKAGDGPDRREGRPVVPAIRDIYILGHAC